MEHRCCYDNIDAPSMSLGEQQIEPGIPGILGMREIMPIW
jgi:hypothetical protein